MVPTIDPPVLALDFDGVVVDSAGEVFQTALGAWDRLNPASSLARDLEQSPERRLAFDRLVPLGNRAEDFGVALHILEHGLNVEDQPTYDRIRKDLGPVWLDRYHQTFYDIRTRNRDESPTSWFAAHHLFTPFVDVLRRRREHSIYAIVTAKDGRSVRRLLEHFGISDLVPDALILDKDLGEAKSTHLIELQRRIEVPLSTVTFIDDKLNHLERTAPLGVRGVLAAWGHNTDREHRQARERGYAVADLDTAEAVLFGSESDRR